MKQILKRTGFVFCCFLLVVVTANILIPLFCKKPDKNYAEQLSRTEFTAETAGTDVYELMLVIDSEKLNQQIRATESDYMEKSKEVLANGHETEGAKYKKKILNRQKKIYYSVLRLLIRPLRQLL